MIPSKLFVPRGLITIAKLTNDVPGPDRPLVEVWNASYSAEETSEPVMSNQDCGPVTIHRDVIGRQPSLECEVHDWDPKNVALALMGGNTAITGAAGTHTYAGALAAGDYVVLPEKGVSALTATDNSIAINPGTDYEETDLEGGLVKILSALTGPVEFSYTFADYTRIDIGGAEDDEYLLSLIAKNRAGNCERSRLRLWSISAAQSGVMQLLAPNDDTDPKPIPLSFLANWVQSRADAGESGYGQYEI